MYEATGKIKAIFDTQTFPSGFTKREFVVTTPDDKYPQDIKFELVKEKCDWLDDLNEGDEVAVNFDIRGNEFKGKYYVNLNCWKLRPASGDQGGRAAQDGPPDEEPRPTAEDDDIPF